MKRLSKLSKEKILIMRLNGATYREIAEKAGVTKQRIQQLIGPPTSVRNFVVKEARATCQECGILCGSWGHVHHVGSLAENYNDTDNLIFLCPSCHRKAHIP